MTWQSARKQAEEGVEIEFPSGNRARVRNVGIQFFLENGGIPDSLSGIVAHLINGQDAQKLDADADKIVRASIVMQNAVAKCAFISPRVVDNPKGEGEISVDDIDEEDKMFILGLLGLPARKLEPFRQECEATLERLRHREDLSGTTQPPTGD
jgi:hypothetical protein